MGGGTGFSNSVFVSSFLLINKPSISRYAFCVAVISTADCSACNSWADNSSTLLR